MRERHLETMLINNARLTISGYYNRPRQRKKAVYDHDQVICAVEKGWAAYLLVILASDTSGVPSYSI